MASCLEIEILMHYATGQGQFRDPKKWNSYIRCAVIKFEDMGLLEREDGDAIGLTFQATDGARTYVEALKNVPFPKQEWVFKHTPQPLSIKDSLKKACYGN